MNKKQQKQARLEKAALCIVGEVLIHNGMICVVVRITKYGEPLLRQIGWAL